MAQGEMESVTFEATGPDLRRTDAQFLSSEQLAPYPPRSFTPHTHDLIEFCIPTKGSVDFRIERNVYHVSPWNILVIKPNEVHNCIISAETQYHYICLWFRPEPEALFRKYLRSGYGSNSLLVPSEEIRARLEVLHREMRACAGTDNALRKYALSLEFLSDINECEGSEDGLVKFPAQLENVLSDIEENFRTVQSLSDLAERHFISLSTLSRLFREYLHISPWQYIENKRLAYACKLLQEGKNVSVSCSEAGFPDYCNFIRLFRRRFHASPSVYRKTASHCIVWQQEVNSNAQPSPDGNSIIAHQDKKR